jgi:hypothetical protein
LKQTNEKVQNDAIAALGSIHTHPEWCVPAIAPFLRSTNELARFCTLQAISDFGISARQWTPTSEIVRCLSDPLVCTAATNTLRRVAPEAAAKAGVR